MSVLLLRSDALLTGPDARSDDLKLEKGPDGFRHAIVEVMLIAYDRDGRPLNLTKGRGDAKLTPKSYEEARRVGFQVHKEIDIPSGYAYLRTGVYDWNSRKAGTLGIPLSVSSLPIPRLGEP